MCIQRKLFKIIFVLKFVFSNHDWKSKQLFDSEIIENDKKINFISKLISSKTSDFNKEIDDIKKMIRIICYKRLLRRQIKPFVLNNKEAKKSIDYCKKYLIDNVPIIDKLYF